MMNPLTVMDSIGQGKANYIFSFIILPILLGQQVYNVICEINIYSLMWLIIYKAVFFYIWCSQFILRLKKFMDHIFLIKKLYEVVFVYKYKELSIYFRYSKVIKTILV